MITAITTAIAASTKVRVSIMNIMTLLYRVNCGSISILLYSKAQSDFCSKFVCKKITKPNLIEKNRII